MTNPHTAMSRELLPCPFPHEAKRGPFVDVDEVEFAIARIACSDCGACGPYVDLADFATNAKAEAAAIDLWNARATQDQSSKEGEANG